ncbi:cupin domain-containing protein [Geothrix fuzhouensis]|uniref:cupin domain-containing protein n=1 Tax=Geothrix fuzhouensis TaxID=2966451 RepID=UPI0021485839|nr:cupin domain-containing protein [Geothrix fuzhouensis]
MTLLMPTCAEVVALLTDYEEGALGPFSWLGVKLHLSLCPPCRTFLDSFERTPGLLRRLWPEPPAPPAERALDSALAALRQGRVPRGPMHHPEEAAWQALEPGGDSLTALLLKVHLGHCDGCRSQHATGEPIPAAGPSGQDALDLLRPHLPAEDRWRWTRKGLGGARVARLLQDPATGATLNLAHMPGGMSMPLHSHGGSELSMVLSGVMQDGPAHLGPGDWLACGPGQQHGPSTEPGLDCWALLRIEGGIRFTGWRRILGAVG